VSEYVNVTIRFEKRHIEAIKELASRIGMRPGPYVRMVALRELEKKSAADLERAS
jgi:predicted DNA binding CopG/RHH family protein